MTPEGWLLLLMFALIIPALSLQAWVAALFCFVFAGGSMLYRRLHKRDFLWIVYVIVSLSSFHLLCLPATGMTFSATSGRIQRSVAAP